MPTRAAKPDPSDPAVIAYMTRHEADMAFRKRVQTIFEWVQPRDEMLILDMPCGRGFYLNMFRYVSDCRLVGAELDWDVLQKAQHNVGHLPNLALNNANIYALPYPDSTFDAVILSEILEHVDDDVAALREVFRVLKPGGVAAITVPNADYPFLWDPINKTLELLTAGRVHIQHGPFAGIWANHVRLYWRDDLRNAVLDAGFKVEEERSFTHACMPFIHNVVYGFGKPVLESGLLGGAGKAADRTAFDQEPGRFNPITLGIRVLNWFDRPNQINEPPNVSTVNLALKARKPADAATTLRTISAAAASRPSGTAGTTADEPRSAFEEESLSTALGQLLRHPGRTGKAFGAVLRGRSPGAPPPAPSAVSLPLDSADGGAVAKASDLDRRVTLYQLAAFGLALIGAWLMAAWGNVQETGLVIGLPLLLAGGGVWAGAEVLRVRRSDQSPRYLRPYGDQAGWLGPPVVASDFRRWVPRIVLFVVAMLFALAGVRGSSGNQFTLAGVIGWAMSVVLVVWAIAPDGWSPASAMRSGLRWLSDWRPRLTWSGGLLLLMMALALLLRAQDLPLAPREMTSDHVEFLLDTYRVQLGNTNVFFSGNGGREALQFYALALFSGLPGQTLSFESLKMLNVLEGVLTLPALYFMAKTVVGRERPQLGTIVGLCVVALVAVSYWHITLSRLGERIILTPLFISLFILTFTRALRDNRFWDYVLTGLVLGVGLYTYQVTRLLPFVVIVGVLIAVVFHWRQRRGLVRLGFHTVVLAVVAFTIFLPLFAYSLEYPEDFWRRTSGRLFGDDVLQTTDEAGNLVSRNATIGERLQAFGQNVPQLATNFGNALLMYHWKGDIAWFQSASLKPAFDPLSGALLAVGCGAWAFLMARWRDPAVWLLPPMALILMFASAFSIAYPTENPSATRMSGTLPIVYLFAGLAMGTIALGIARWTRGRAGSVVAAVGVGVILFGSGQANLNTYWLDYVPLYTGASEAHSTGGALMRQFVESGGRYGNTFAVGYPYWWDHRALGIEAGRFDYPNGIPSRTLLPNWLENGLARTDDYRLDPNSDLLFLLSPQDEETTGWLRTLFPAATVQDIQTYQPNELFRIVVVPAPGEESLRAAIELARSTVPQG